MKETKEPQSHRELDEAFWGVVADATTEHFEKMKAPWIAQRKTLLDKSKIKLAFENPDFAIRHRTHTICKRTENPFHVV